MCDMAYGFVLDSRLSCRCSDDVFITTGVSERSIDEEKEKQAWCNRVVGAGQVEGGDVRNTKKYMQSSRCRIHQRNDIYIHMLTLTNTYFPLFSSQHTTDRASFMGGHRQDGRAQGAGAVRSGLVLHARGFHGAANLPAQGTWSGCVQAQVRWTQAKGNVHGALHHLERLHRAPRA